MGSPRLFLAKRYARAFLNLFPLEMHHVDRINEAITFFSENSELFSLLKVPLLDARLKQNALDECLLVRVQLPPSFGQLTRVLVEQKRSYLIADVLRQIVALYQKRQGIELFKISVFPALTNSQEQVVTHFLQKKTGHAITCCLETDEHLIAGIRMQSDEHLWEYSVQQQLARLSTLLKDQKDY